MRIQVKGRGGASADDELRSRVEKKLARLRGRSRRWRSWRSSCARRQPVDRRLAGRRGDAAPEGRDAPSAASAPTDMGHSINLVADDLARQVKKHRDKRRARREAQQHAAQEHAA